MVNHGEIVVRALASSTFVNCRQILEATELLRRLLLEKAEQFRCRGRIGPEGRHIDPLGIFTHLFTKTLMQSFTQISC